jgi:hypothetical protein
MGRPSTIIIKISIAPGVMRRAPHQLALWMYVRIGPFPSLPVKELSSSPNLITA